MFFCQVECCNYTGFPRGKDCFGISDPIPSAQEDVSLLFQSCVNAFLGHNALSVNVDFCICFFTDQLKLYSQRTSHIRSMFLSEDTST